MGNRAIIKAEGKNTGVYLHWNGGRDSVEAFLEYCKLKKYRNFEDSYGMARFTQVVSNFFGGSTSIGIEHDLRDTESFAKNFDNGIYIVKGWDIVNRIPSYICEQRNYDLLEMMMSIDEAQPKSEQLGNYLGALEISTKDLKIGDMVYYMDFEGKIKLYPVVGFGAKETRFEGLPYIKKYGNDIDGYDSNPNNYIFTKTVKIAKLNDKYKRFRIENIKKMFSDEPNKGDILLYIPEKKEYLGIAFGCGDNLEPDFDGYLYLTQHSFECSYFEEYDGGQMDYMDKDTNYDNICDTIFDVFNFIYGNECIEFEVMQ